MTGSEKAFERRSGREDCCFEFDAYYLKNRSFFFDLKILWMTFIKVVKREGVTH